MLENAQDYYGKVLSGSADLRTDACCTAEMPSDRVRRAMANIHEEVRARYYGCGLVVPQAIEGAHVLDLGSGAGQDAYLLAQRDKQPKQASSFDREVEATLKAQLKR